MTHTDDGIITVPSNMTITFGQYRINGQIYVRWTGGVDKDGEINCEYTIQTPLEIVQTICRITPKATSIYYDPEIDASHMAIRTDGKIGKKARAELDAAGIWIPESTHSRYGVYCYRATVDTDKIGGLTI